MKKPKAKAGKASAAEREVRWLVTHRKDEVKQVLRDVRRLMRGRRHYFGANVLMLVSLLELELVRQKKTPLVDAARGRR